MNPIDISDPIARRAVEILVQALAKKQLRGVVEMRQCVDALNKYLENPNRETAEFAARAFNAIDGSLRQMVADLAFEEARVSVGKPAKPPPPPPVESGGWRGFGLFRR